MIKNLLYFALVLLTANAYGQAETATAPPASTSTFKRVYVGVSTIQGVGYRLLSRNPNVGAADGLENIRDYIITSRNDREKSGYAANGGVRVGVNVTKFFAVETGVTYSYNSYSSKSNNLNFGSQWNGNGYDATLSDSVYLPSSVKFIYAYHQFSIPLAFNFTLGKGKVRALISAGANFDVLVKATTTSYWNNRPERKGLTNNITSKFQTFNISPFLGIGIDYQITSLMSLRVMPIFQIQALPNIAGTPITERLYSGGINVALNFGFIDAKPNKFNYDSVIGTKKNGKPKD